MQSNDLKKKNHKQYEAGCGGAHLQFQHWEGRGKQISTGASLVYIFQFQLSQSYTLSGHLHPINMFSAKCPQKLRHKARGGYLVATGGWRHSRQNSVLPSESESSNSTKKHNRETTEGHITTCWLFSTNS